MREKKVHFLLIHRNKKKTNSTIRVTVADIRELGAKGEKSNCWGKRGHFIKSGGSLTSLERELVDHT